MFSLFLESGIFSSLFFICLHRMDGNELFSYYFLLILISLSFFCKKKREVDLRLLAFFLLYLVLSSLRMIDFKPIRGTTLNFLLGVLSLKVISERIDLSYKRFGYFAILFCLITNVHLVLQLLGIAKFYMKVYGDAGGFSLVPWIMGCTAALLMPFIYAVNPVACLITIPMLYYSRSSSCVLVGILSFLCLLFINKKFKPLILLSSILIPIGIWFITMHDSPASDRFVIWRESIHFNNHFKIGQGFGTWAHEGFVRITGGVGETYHWRWAHNEWFQLWYETGWVGLILFLIWFSRYIKCRNEPLISLISISILSMVHPVLHLGQLIPIGIYIFAQAEIYLAGISTTSHA